MCFHCLQQEIDGTPLIYACLHGHTEIAEILIKNGAAVDHLSAVMMEIIILYSGKLSREKTFINFTVLEPSTKQFSPQNLGVPYPPMAGFSIP